MLTRADVNKLNYLYLGLLFFLIGLLFIFSTSLREDWVVGTWSKESLCPTNCVNKHDWCTATSIIFVQNWFKESPLKHKFMLMATPKSIETPSMREQVVYSAYPPGAYLLLYSWFLLIDIFSTDHDIADSPVSQILSLTALNYVLHALIVFLLCATVFMLMRRLRFNHLNALLMAMIPAIIFYLTPSLLFWYHILWSPDSVVILFYVLYVYLEMSRAVYGDKIPLSLRIIQPLVMFCGVFTDWLFVFLVLVVYLMRMRAGEIVSLTSRARFFTFMRQSLVFSAPMLIAILIWAGQLAIFFTAGGEFTLDDKRLEIERMMNSGQYDLGTALLQRLGVLYGLAHYLQNIYHALGSYLTLGYGVFGLLILAFTFYLVVRSKDFEQTHILKHLYLLMLVPCILHVLVFNNHSWAHNFSMLKFSLPLSVAIVVAVIILCKMFGRNIRAPLFRIKNIQIYKATVICLLSALCYSSVHVFAQGSLTKFFAKPDYHFIAVGNYVRKNTAFDDVAFSTSIVIPALPPHLLSISGKRIYYADNLDWVYDRVENFTENFNIKIFFSDENSKPEVFILDEFLQEQGFATDLHTVADKSHSNYGFLRFSGQKFLAWYKQGISSAAN